MTAVATISPHLSSLHAPEALRRLPAWLIWRFEPGDTPDDKPRKVPYYATGRKRHGVQGRAEDREQLVTFDAARAAAAMRGFEGVGFAPMADWGIVALDFDDCVADGRLHPDVEAVVATTYAEFSPSGKGIRAFFRGQLGNLKSHTDKESQRYGLELFSSKGFVTVTGNMLPGVELLGNEDTIAPVDEQVMALVQRRFKRELAALEAPVDGGKPLGMSLEQITEALSVLDPNMGHEPWLQVGMALHHETAGQGFEIWDEWSGGGASYPGTDKLRERWASFGRGSGPATTARTLVKMANDNGARISTGADVAKAEDFDPPPVAVSTEPEPLPAFERDVKGKIKPTVRNALAGLRRPDVCQVSIANDTFKDTTLVCWAGEGQWRPIRDTDFTRMRARLESLGFKGPGRELVRDAVLQVAEENQFDSAIEWASALVWDGVPRVERFLAAYMSTEDVPYTRAVSRYIWTALAARLSCPGYKCDMVPVLVGGQGTGKTTGVMAMAPEPDAYVEVNLEHRDDNLARSLRGKLVGELGELRGLMSKEAEAIKAWITRTHEEWIPKYVEFATKFPRRLVFIGTTNNDEFLADDTGERRWLPVRVGQVDAQGIARDRDQLWAEALVMFTLDGLGWRDAMTLGADEHDDYKITDPWMETVRRWLAEDEMDHPGVARSERPFKTENVLASALNLETARVAMREQKRVAAVLRRLGYDKRRATRTEGGKFVWERAENCTQDFA